MRAVGRTRAHSALFHNHGDHTEARDDTHDFTSVFMTLTLTEACIADPRESDDEFASRDEQTHATTRVDPREILLAAQVCLPTMLNTLSVIYSYLHHPVRLSCISAPCQ